MPLSKLPFETVLPIARRVVGYVERGERVWVHCSRGVDRTGMVLGGAAVLLGGDPTAVADKLLTIFNARYQTDLRSLLAHQRSVVAAFGVGGPSNARSLKAETSSSRVLITDASAQPEA